MGGYLKAAIHGMTDVGLARDHNEDSILWDNDMGLALLADGMGGHNAGEVASAMAVDQVRAALRERLLGRQSGDECEECESAVFNAVTFANQQIFDHSQQHLECAGMGTTMALALLQGDNLTLAHVGDSRIYRLRGGALQQITSDHSLVQELVDNGYLSQEEARLSVSKNLITRALGIGAEVEVEVSKQPVEVGDLYLLCSDGLTDLVADEEIQAILKKDDALDDIARGLVSLANERGGSDNISVILMHLHQAFADDNGINDSVG